MNGFRKMQQRLREEGWYVGWNLPCCQSCAWAELPDTFDDGTDIDLSKVLFNHSQDCEVDHDYVECETCDESGYLDDDCLEECADCAGEGYKKHLTNKATLTPAYMVSCATHLSNSQRVHSVLMVVKKV